MGSAQLSHAAALDVRSFEAASRLQGRGEFHREEVKKGTERLRESPTFQPGRNTHSHSVISIADVGDRKCEWGSSIQG